MIGSSSSPTIGQQLRHFRVAAGLSQEALAEASGVSVRTISDLERGQRPSAHMETVRLLASALGLTDDDRHQLLAAARAGAHPEDEVTSGKTLSRIGSAKWKDSLPAPATPLVGRADELYQISTLLGAKTRHIVTLTGPGGVGKTRLAIEAARQSATAFADGAVFVNLATISQAELVLDAIAQVFGMAMRADPIIDRLTALLETRELVLVLDNFEHVVEAAPSIAELSANWPHVVVLVTSRVRLRVSAEREIAIPPLEVADQGSSLQHLRSSGAVRLFGERASMADPDFELSDQNTTAIAEICRRLDGLPLAIELAAPRLRVLPVATLLERLDQRLPLLTGGPRDLPRRQQSMRETIAWSYDLLEPEEQRFLRWAAVFVGGLSLESTEALGRKLGLDAFESLEIVTTLIDSALLQSVKTPEGMPRFQMFETIREFGLEQLGEAGELDAARLFHATHFLELASRGAPRPDEPVPVAWVSRLSTEHPNLLEAFDYLCVPETVEQSLRFAAAVGPYWSTRGPFSEWQSGLSRAIEHVSPEPTIVQTHVLYWLTMILGASPDFSAALQAANRCVEMADQVGTPSDRAAALHIRAWVHECHQHWEIAREQCDQAIELSITVGNTYMQAMCLMMKATSACALGELDHAQCEAEQAASMFRALDALDQCALIGCVLAMIAVARGELALAAAYCEESLRTWLSTETLTRWFRPLVGLAYVAAALGQFATAARLLGGADAMLIAGGRDLSQFDRPAYERAEARCREALGLAEFEEQRLAGSLLTPDAWLLEASYIVEAARRSSTSPSL